ncbi:MAG: DNA-processing protein DprA [Thermodesulfovibrionales bacterium]
MGRGQPDATAAKKRGARSAPASSHQADDLACLIALTLINDIGPVTARRLLSAFSSPRKIFEARLPELESVEEIGGARLRKILEFEDWKRVEKEIGEMRRSGIIPVAWTDPAYPELLRPLDDAPVLLYTKGTLIDEDRYAIAMVGSRRMTDYGKRAAALLAADLSSCGLTIVSGMARGIDTVSHAAALDAGGRSIAVLGCGLDRPYPPENKELFERLCRCGCVISEFPTGTPPLREHFPRRNRLISGLSLGTLIVEATLKSGSLITARYALEQNREVFAVPGSIYSRCSEGTHALLSKGARPVRSAGDVLEELSPLLKGMLRSPKAPPAPSGQLEISGEEKAICSILSSDPKHIDLIARELGISPAKLSGLLLGLELKGVVGQTEGRYFYIL